MEEDNDGNAPLFFGSGSNRGKETLTFATTHVPSMLSGREIAPWRMRDGCDNDDESLFSGGGSSEAESC